jgi:hypothetical protein
MSLVSLITSFISVLFFISWLIRLKVHPLFIYFPKTTLVNSAVMNISVQVFLMYPNVCSFGWMPRSSISRSYGSSISCFLRNIHTAFHSGCTNLHSHQQCIRVTVLPHPHHHLLFLLPLIMAILIGVG